MFSFPPHNSFQTSPLLIQRAPLSPEFVQTAMIRKTPRYEWITEENPFEKVKDALFFYLFELWSAMNKDYEFRVSNISNIF